MTEEKTVVMKLCTIGEQERLFGGNPDIDCKLYYPVLTDAEIDEKIAEDPDFNYIEYTINLYNEDVHDDHSLHWICRSCNRISSMEI